MDLKQKKRKTNEKNNLIKLKHEYWEIVFRGVVKILQSSKQDDNDIFTIEYVVNKHKSCLFLLNFCDTHRTFPTPNLSFELYEKFISLVAHDAMAQIKKEIKDAVYYSISIDSVPDIDRSAIYIRYVDEDGIPRKHFLDVLNKKGDDAKQIMDMLHMTLDKYNLSHSGFMGLSYNVDSNILKERANLKPCIKLINNLAEIVPCSSDSLSLVVIKAASSCHEGNSFFTTIDELFNFFVVYESHWDEIKFLFKNLSYKQFSSKNKICQRLNENWPMMVYALFHISENMSIKQKIRISAYILLTKVKRLETCFMTIFWEDIIGKITELENKLIKYVTAKINFHKIFEIYQSLINYLKDFRTDEKFIDYKNRAFEKSNILHFNNKNRIEKPQMRFPVNYDDEDNKFKIKTYFYVIDEIQNELAYRQDIYRDLTSKFQFLNRISTIPDSELCRELENLQSVYLDLSFHISAEFNELKKILLKGKTDLTSVRNISTFISQSGYGIFFEELSKVTKMVLCISATNCQVEHSTLSVLKKVITSLGSTMSEDSFNSLLLINMEQKLLKKSKFKHVIQDFAISQSTK